MLTLRDEYNSNFLSQDAQFDLTRSGLMSERDPISFCFSVPGLATTAFATSALRAATAGEAGD
jgi:hypothetical protein